MSEPSYHTAKIFTDNLLAIEMKKTDTYKKNCLFRTFNTRIQHNINVWDLVWLFKTKIWWKNKTVWYGYVNRDDISKDIAEDVESRADTSNYDLDRASSREKKKKVIRLMKDELGGKIMTNLLG